MKINTWITISNSFQNDISWVQIFKKPKKFPYCTIFWTLRNLSLKIWFLTWTTPWHSWIIPYLIKVGTEKDHINTNLLKICSAICEIFKPVIYLGMTFCYLSSKRFSIDCVFGSLTNVTTPVTMKLFQLITMLKRPTCQL